MKKIKYLIVLLLLITLTGCNKNTKEKVIKEFKNNINSSTSYKITGKLEIFGDEETYSYNINVSYKKKSLYKVELINELTNHEQIILKNDEGTYVITPNLNKSYKFDTDWPNNSSQSYILESILNDLNTTEQIDLEEKDDLYILKSNVNYVNNSNLSYQLLYIDKEYYLKTVEVYDNDNQMKVRFNITNQDYKASLTDDEFNLDNNIDTNCCNEEEETSSFDEILYPLYIPTDTYLTSKETLSTETGTRAILTFSGSKNFVLVEETSTKNEDFEIVPIYGEPLMLNGTIAAMSSNSLYWTSNNIDYYLASSELNQEEMLLVANSISNTIVTGK